MTTENEQSFLTQLVEICRLSSTIPWKIAVQKALNLFAEAAGAQDAVLLILGAGQSPLYWMAYKQGEPPALLVMLQKYSSRWKKALLNHGCSSLTFPEQVTPVWLLPIPPHTDTLRGVMAFSGVTQDFPQALFEQGGALLAPLVHSAQLQYESDAPPGGSDSVAMRRQRRRQTYLEGLYTLISTINTETNLDEILRAGLSQAMQIGNMVEGQIYLLNRREQILRLTVCLGGDSSDVKPAVFLPGEGGPGRAFVERWMVVERDPTTVAGVKEPMTHINLPLISGGQVVGVMRLSTPDRQALSLEITQLLVTIADQLALTLQRGQLADHMQIARRLYEISTAFLSQTSSSGSIFLLLRTLHDNIGSAVGTIFYQFTRKRWARAQIYSTGNPTFNALWTEGPATDAEIEFLENCRRERMSMLCPSKCSSLPPFWGNVEAVGGKQLLYFPILSPGQDCAGVAAVLMAEERALEENEAILAWAIVQQSIAALARIRHYEESQRSESLLRAILESSRDGIILVDIGMPEMNIRYLNMAAVDMLMLPNNPMYWEGRTLPEVIAAVTPHIPLIAEWLTKVAHQQLGADPSSEIAVEAANDKQQRSVFETPNGSYLQAQSWGISPKGEYSTGILFLFRDITEAITLERMREDLFNMLVHDMRNPLATTEYSLRLLLDPEMRDVTVNLINIAMTGIERLRNMVEMILEVSRWESGRFELHPQVLVLADHVAEIVQRMVMPHETIHVDMAIAPDLPSLWVDVAAITRVFENLLNNALKFVPQTEGRIAISAVSQGEWVQVEIYNNGPPIPPEMQKRLFQKYVVGQYHGRGYGLGLALCRLVVEGHGGKIWAKNQSDGGVSFYFTLPVWQGPELEHALLA